MKHAGVWVSAVLDGVLHDGLQRQRRHPEPDMRRVIFHRKAVIILGLFHGEIGAHMFKLGREGNGIGACNGSKILAQIGCEIQNDLPGPFRILIAETVNAGHGVVDKVRPHLQDHDAGALIRNLLLMPQVLFDLVGQDDAVHGESGKDDADVNQRVDICKQMHGQRSGHGQLSDEKAQPGFPGKASSAHDRTGQIAQHEQGQGQYQKRIQRTAGELTVRGQFAETADERGTDNQNGIDGPQNHHDKKESGGAEIFSGAVQQINGQHGYRQRKQQGFQSQPEDHGLSGKGITLKNHFQEGGKADQHQNDKVRPEEMLAPPADAGHDDNKPETQPA